jgi:hypothetical protein
MSVVAVKVEDDLFHTQCVPSTATDKEEVTADPNDECANCGAPLGEAEDEDEDNKDEED